MRIGLLNLVFCVGFWYFAILGVRTKIRNWKHERYIRDKRKDRTDAYTKRGIDGGVIYPENRHREEVKLLTHR